MSNLSNCHLEVAKLKEILLKNGYHRKTIDACDFKFLNKSFESKPVTLTVPGKQHFIILPFMGDMSGVIKTGLSKAIRKDILPEPLRSWHIYKFICGSCNASNTSNIFRHLKVRVSKHQRVSLQTGKIIKVTLSTFVRDHMLEYDYIVTWDNFKVQGRESNHWLLKIK